MSDSRIENLGVLFTAMPAVIATGKMPDLAQPEAITPLYEEFSDALAIRRWRGYVHTHCDLSDTALSLLIRARHLPSAVHALAVDEMDALGLAPDFSHKVPHVRMVARTVATALGVELTYSYCCLQGLRDRDWHAVRNGLLRLRESAKLCGSTIRVRGCGRVEVARALGIKFQYVYEVAEGYRADVLVRAALHFANTAGRYLHDDEAVAFMRPFADVFRSIAAGTRVAR